MPELSDLRILLRDRQLKEGALGSCESAICLDTSLVEALAELEIERLAAVTINAASTTPAKDKRLAGSTTIIADTTDLDAQIEAARKAVSDASVRVLFRALSSVRYQSILNEHPDAEEEGIEPFLVDLVAACFFEVRGADNAKIDISWEELRAGITYGEWEPISVAVLAMNRRKVDVPFSLKSSKVMR